MSTLQHINSVVNYNWPELSRKYPGFDKPQIVPAATLRGIAPVYLRSAIDQDPTSYFMFIAGDATKGDCSREKACEFFDELFYEKLQMPSSFEANEGYTREEAIDKEVLPPATDRQFRSFYDEQMAKVNAEQERQRRIDDLGFDPDDPSIIDITDEVTIDGQSANTDRAVGQAQTTAVGMPKKIFYCVDFHCSAGGMLGYSGGGRLDGRRRPDGYLRESESPVSDILAAFKDLPEDLKKDMEQIALGDGAVIVRHKGGKFTVVEDGKPVMERVSVDEVKKSDKLGKKQLTVMAKDEINKMLSECDAGPEEMMKEFVEKKENGEVEEDEYRRPKNQPHNLHQIDEEDAPTEYHNRFGSDLLACIKGMDEETFNDTRVVM